MLSRQTIINLFRKDIAHILRFWYGEVVTLSVFNWTNLCWAVFQLVMNQNDTSALTTEEQIEIAQNLLLLHKDFYPSVYPTGILELINS